LAGTTTKGGDGGTGIVSSITGARTFYGGGGGGGSYQGVITSLGGAGGGGSGGAWGSTPITLPGAGFANTGGGGGGSDVSASGGSGIVVIRYPAYLAPATAVGANTYISGPYRVYVWVSSGSITF
jgi:hypothetical protein